MLRCSTCLRTEDLVKCSKPTCQNMLCPKHVADYAGKHCNSCYVSRNVLYAPWVFLQ
jgi:hypothetical protein